MPLKATDAQVIAAYTKTGSVWKAAKLLGMCGQSVHERLKKLGMEDRDRWQEWQLELIRQAYQSQLPKLDQLAEKIGKLKSNICRKAREMGLTKHGRKRGVSKYNLPQSKLRELFDDFKTSQPITVSEFARSRGYWPYGLMGIFRKNWPNESRKIITDRYKRKDYVLIRFAKKFKIVDSGCWEWQASRFEDGYGRFTAFGENKAHRVAHILYKGEIPEGLLVCHHCDNPPCVNPDHVYAGTHTDNVRDSIKRGRRRVLK